MNDFASNEIAEKVNALLARGTGLIAALHRVAVSERWPIDMVERAFAGYVEDLETVACIEDLDEDGDGYSFDQSIDLATYTESESFDTWGEYQQDLVDIYRNEY